MSRADKLATALNVVDDELCELVTPYAWVEGPLPDDVRPAYKRLLRKRARLVRLIAAGGQ